jgi:CBS domain-containing protein
MIMMWPVATVEGGATLTEAAEELAADDVGALLVLEHGTLVGVLSERDVVRQIGKHDDPDHVEVRDVMSVDIVSVAPSDSIIEAARRMTSAGVRHIPVVDTGMIAGIVSGRDVLGVLTESVASEADVLYVDSGTRLVVCAR